MRYLTPLSLLCASYVLSQKISFSSGLTPENLQHSFGGAGYDDIDISSFSQFSGLTTFANLQYVNCFPDDKVEAYDVALLGAPFDTVSVFCIKIFS